MILKIAFLMLCSTAPSFAQRPSEVVVSFVLRDSSLAERGIDVEQLKFYVSNLGLGDEGGVVVATTAQHRLVDFANSATTTIPTGLPAERRHQNLVFTLGVDSLTASSGVFGGDLDPTNGMYWTWRSGYVNFKLEGSAPECPARLNRFQFHVGGYRGNYRSQRNVLLKTRGQSNVTVVLDLDRLFTDLDLSENHHIMSPSARSAALADRLAGLFSIQQP